ncbi:hypothetical protein VP395_00725 [Mariniflexile soesokkakense]|uniref:Uncharacterized protein n=1 Tax=Mariniflexile soesokkakense TaxID=1343160 RepID=A0ABV0A5X7_9FLAO
MSTFKIKTHRIGKTYANPHFFILNKGLNSGKPLTNPCPNCFVITTPSEDDKNTLFHLSMMLLINGNYHYYLKGSVIPFIAIKVVKNLIHTKKNSNWLNEIELQKKIETIKKVETLEVNFKSN